MKRTYKQGDWFRVPLGGDYDAIGVIARACRSRLFGYFFAVPSSRELTHDELRAFRAGEAVAVMLFGGKPLEDARWRILATSLAFDPQAWPFPAFASRGAFGEAWTQVRYDQLTMQIVERRRIDADAAALLPDARFAGAQDAELLLRRRIAGEPASSAHSVLEVRSPIDFERLRPVEHGGRVQFSTALSTADFEVLAAFIGAHPQIALRVHGFRHGFDCPHLAKFGALRELTLDVYALQHADALRELRSLQRLRIGVARTNLGFLDGLENLESLELRATRASLEPVLRAHALQALHLESTTPLDFGKLASMETLQALVLSHGDYELRCLDALANLARLELRSLDVPGLPPLDAFARVEYLHIHGLTHVHDLAPIASAPALRELRITGMPQLNVGDFQPLQRCAALQRFTVDVGSRTKEREIYRLLKLGHN